MAGEIKDMDDAFPYGLSPECVAHRHGLGESGPAAVLGIVPIQMHAIHPACYRKAADANH